MANVITVISYAELQTTTDSVSCGAVSTILTVNDVFGAPRSSTASSFVPARSVTARTRDALGKSSGSRMGVPFREITALVTP
jgi:hypothetical protein